MKPEIETTGVCPMCQTRQRLRNSSLVSHHQQPSNQASPECHGSKMAPLIGSVKPESGKVIPFHRVRRYGHLTVVK